MVLALVSVLHAAGSDGLMEASRGAPTMAVWCSSAQTAMNQFEQLGDFARQMPEIPNFTGNVVADGSLEFSYWKESDQVRIRFDSTESAEALARKFAGDGEVRTKDGAWIFQNRGGKDTVIRQDGTHIWMESGEPSADPAVPEPTMMAVSQTALERRGCALSMDFSGSDDPKLAGSRLLAHFPEQRGDGIYFALAGPMFTALKGVPAPDRAPVSMTTPVPADALLVLGLSASDLKLDGVLDRKKMRTFRRFQRMFPIADGTTIGVMAKGAVVDLAVAVPLQHPVAPGVMSRRIRGLLKKMNVSFSQDGKAGLTIVTKEETFRILCEKNRILGASDLSLITAMQTGQGTPWLQGKVGELAGRYPLVVTSSIFPGEGEGGTRRLSQPITLALGMENGIISGYLVMPIPMEELKQLMDEARNLRKKPEPE